MISHKHRFIFVHAGRTGGTSFERIAGQDVTNDERTKHLGNTDFDGKHLGFQYYQRAFPSEFKTFFKFTIVRNPFDRLVSQWFWRTTVIKDHQGMSLKEFILTRHESSKYSEKFKLSGFSINDSLKQFDYIGRFEDLHNTYRYLLEKLNIQQTDMVYSNKTIHNNYQDYYTAETIDIVNVKYGLDLELFDYKF